MDFKVRKIHRGNPQIKNKFWRILVRIFGPKGAILVIILGILIGSSFAFSRALEKNFWLQGARTIATFGPLEKDQNGHINFVFLGVAGSQEEGGNLSDSIMLVSLYPEKRAFSMLSLPRDLFIASEIGDRKINEIYAAARWEKLLPVAQQSKKSVNELAPEKIENANQHALEVVKKAISGFTGIQIHYAGVIDFQIFEEVVDVLGGVEVFVPETIVDPFYPAADYGYQTFTIRKGFQNLDGATALKYARSRKTSSDYSRAARQQELGIALQKKAADLRLLTDTEKLKHFYDLFRQNITIDQKLGWSQMAALAKVAAQIEMGSAIAGVLNDDASQKGGFLYTPAKEFFGGQFVLLPESLKDTQYFIDLILLHPEILRERAQISILNGSQMPGKAAEMAAYLRRFGFHVIEIGNYPTDSPLFESFIAPHPERAGGPQTLQFLIKQLEVKKVENLDPKFFDPLVDLVLVLGIN